MHPCGSHQHVHLVLVAVALQLHQLAGGIQRERAQAGLGVVNADAAGKREHAQRDLVAQAAAQRHVAGERAGAQHQCIGMGAHLLRDGDDVLDQMLTVGVGEHHAVLVRHVLQNVANGRLHACALAAVDLMREQRHLGRNLRKNPVEVRAAAVVDHDDPIIGFAEQLIDQGQHLFVRLVGRNHNYHRISSPLKRFL